MERVTNHEDDQFLRDHVFDVYEKIAEEFDSTRYKIWPSVAHFIEKTIDQNQNILEIGFGNGKNLEYIVKNFSYLQPQIFGIDTCKKFLQIAAKKFENHNLDLRIGDQRDLQFEDQSMDIILSIAVFHHLDKEKDRVRAIQELWRVLKTGGFAMIQVWAKEQPADSKRKFDTQDEMVGWKDKAKRYYHVFVEGELNNLIQTSIGFQNYELHVYDEKGNWVAILQKK